MEHVSAPFCALGDTTDNASMVDVQVGLGGREVSMPMRLITVKEINMLGTSCYMEGLAYILIMHESKELYGIQQDASRML